MQYAEKGISSQGKVTQLPSNRRCSLTPGIMGGKMSKKQKGVYRMGWKNQVICQLKGYVRAAYGEGALFLQ